MIIKNTYLDIAENDLEYLEAVLKTGNTFYNQLAVQCQQIAEKFLKGYLERLLLEEDVSDLLRKNNMRKIAAKLNDINPELNLDIIGLSYLTDFYFDARYPGDDFYTVSKEEFEKCLAIMYDTVNKIKINGSVIAMNGFFLLLPFLAVRFLLPLILNPKALARAAYFAPVQGREKTAYYIYQMCNIAMFIYLFFLKIRPGDSWQFYTGLLCYILGLCLLTAAMVNFSFPDETGFNRRGLYRFSRNPMYVAYFICFAGMAFLTRSGILLGLVTLFQISAHWIILAEERWCIRKFGDRYREYMKRVRRYI